MKTRNARLVTTGPIVHIVRRVSSGVGGIIGWTTPCGRWSPQTALTWAYTDDVDCMACIAAPESPDRPEGASYMDISFVMMPVGKDPP